MSPIGIIGIVVALAIFLYGAYKNVSVLYLAPLCGIIVAVTNVMSITTYDFVNGQLVSNPRQYHRGVHQSPRRHC